MFVKIINSFVTASGAFNSGELYDVTDALGMSWIIVGYAVESEIGPPYVEQLLGRLKDGSGEDCLFLPFVGEFGHLCMSHLRFVHFHESGRKIVCCRPGEEVLYPDADEFFTYWIDPIEDAKRVATMRDTRRDWPEITALYPGVKVIHAGGLSPSQELYAINPCVRIPFRPVEYGLSADVAIGVRSRAFCPERNWKHWQTVAANLSAAGVSFAVIGHRSTSFDLDGQSYHSGDFDTDAAVELLQNCKLYVGNDSGASHLAATVGAEMLIFRESESGSRNLVPRMREVNPDRIEEVDGWDDPRSVVDAIFKLLESK